MAGGELRGILYPAKRGREASIPGSYPTSSNFSQTTTPHRFSRHQRRYGRPSHRNGTFTPLLLARPHGLGRALILASGRSHVAPGASRVLTRETPLVKFMSIETLAVAGPAGLREAGVTDAGCPPGNPTFYPLSLLAFLRIRTSTCIGALSLFKSHVIWGLQGGETLVAFPGAPQCCPWSHLMQCYRSLHII